MGGRSASSAFHPPLWGPAPGGPVGWGRHSVNFENYFQILNHAYIGSIYKGYYSHSFALSNRRKVSKLPRYGFYSNL